MEKTSGAFWLSASWCICDLLCRRAESCSLALASLFAAATWLGSGSGLGLGLALFGWGRVEQVRCQASHQILEDLPRGELYLLWLYLL